MSAPPTEGPAEANAVSSARADLVSCGRTLLARGLLSQTSGNLSIRVSSDEVCITPSGMEYDRLEPADMVLTGTDGNLPARASHPRRRRRRCTAWSMQPAGCLRDRPYAFPPYATTLAILGLPIPAVHYMIARARTTQIEGGQPTRPTGPGPRWRRTCETRSPPPGAGRPAGQSRAGCRRRRTLQEAADVAEAMEMLARLYCQALSGRDRLPVLSPDQMAGGDVPSTEASDAQARSA